MTVGTYTITEKSIGTAGGRDYSTAASWEAALPADVTPDPNALKQVGVMYADSVFTEGNTIFSGHGEEFRVNTILRAAVGHEWSLKDGEAGKVCWRPVAGSVRALQVSANAVGLELYGIEFDGINQTGAAAAGLVHVLASTIHVTRCSFHHEPQGYGLTFSTSTQGQRFIANCIFSNNAIDGFRRLSDNLGRGMQFEYCGFYNNAGYGARGATAGSSGNFDFRHCWFVDNTLGSWEDAGGNLLTGWCSMTDALATPDANLMYAMLETQTEAGMKFVDAPNGDFHIQAGSTLLLQGHTREVTIKGTTMTARAEDADGNHLAFAGAASRYDIGPHQLSHAAAAIVTPDAPVIAFVSSTATTITLSITGTGGNTVEVFSWLPGATVGVSEGTRIGDGNFIADPVIEGIAYRFTAAVEAS